MKRKLLVTIIISLCLLLSACGGNKTEDTQSQVENHYFVDGKELSEKEYQEYLEEKEQEQKELEELEKELTEGEKVAVYTIQQLRDSLKNPHSLEIYSICYKRQNKDETGDYYFKIEYAANNDLGGKVEDTLYYKVDMDIFSDDSKKALSAKMFGCEAVHFNDYDTGRRADYTETEINIDRVLYNIDTVIVE